MGNLTLNELSNSLNDYMDEKQNMEDHSLMTENKTIVSAINEIYGKQLIADAIGEPLNENDTFSAMSNDINGLLSTFKSNLMNNGVTVESGDKFKQLIDKIKTISENSNNRFKFAEGKIDDFTFTMPGQNVAAPKTCDLNDLDFKPTYLFINIKTLGYIAMNQNNAALEADMNITISNLFNDENNYTLYRVPGSSGDFVRFSLSNITDKSCDILIARYIYQMSPEHYKNISWIAIGVGEEDTTLRDSLASILQEEGVSVTEEDDMASLITKVDEEFDRINAEASIIKTGTATISNLYSDAKTFTVNINPGFVPKEIICTIKSFKFNYSSGSFTTITAPTVVYSKYNNTASTYVTISPRNGNYGADVYISSISQSNFVVTITRFTGYSIPYMSIEWTAIS